MIELRAVNEGELYATEGKYAGYCWDRELPEYDWLWVRIPWWSRGEWHPHWVMHPIPPGRCWLVIVHRVNLSGEHLLHWFKEPL